ncbi:hypothetical protein D9619_010817 [Psilocybe cf. subviscida]|uniref:CCHC-type domain-containing protein n=1 Tax=Psilocybe cf. subviscida TaxID=2480587 RepID=A0A8H5B8G8_9AGAR|nr:hypothetical protein D9619_010817 [Psilocybe cf. subviscida]
MKGMPTRRQKEAPLFDPKHSEELLRYFDELERLFNIHEIDSNKAHKYYAAFYTPAHVEQEWKAMDAYRKPDINWAGFKKAIIKEYPAAMNLEKGTLEGLINVCRKYQDVGEEDLTQFLQFKRAFIAEYTKLGPLMANHSLVQYFLGSLDIDFRRHVMNTLESSIHNRKYLEKYFIVQWEEEQRVEHRFTIGEVIEVAETLTRNCSTMGGKLIPITKTIRVTSTEDSNGKLMERLEAQANEIAMLKDHLQSSTKQLQSMILEELKKVCEEPKTQFQQVAMPQQGHEAMQGSNQGMIPNSGQGQMQMPMQGQSQGCMPMQGGYQPTWQSNQGFGGQQGFSGNCNFGRSNFGNPGGVSPGFKMFNKPQAPSYGNCHYCGQTGHFGFDCMVHAQHVKDGKIQIGQDRGVYLPEGHKVPWENGTPMIRYVEDYYKQQAEGPSSAALLAEIEDREQNMARMAAYVEQMEYAMMYGSDPPVVPPGNSDSDWRTIAITLQKEKDDLRTQLANRHTCSQTQQGFD